jgi:hypothetical protein
MPTDVRPHDVPRQLIEVVRANGAEIGEGGNLLMAVLAVRRSVFHNVSNGLAQKRLLSLSDVVG